LRFLTTFFGLLITFVISCLTTIDDTWATSPSKLAQPTGHTAFVLEINGPIGPATSDYFLRALHKVSNQSVAFIILRIDTPGGLDIAMRDIIKGIIGSSIPVISYVSPSGARAASAGTYILYASHVAAMAPATNLGAATPVQIGGVPDISPKAPSNPGAKDKPTSTDKPASLKTPMAKKRVNDAVAYIRGLATLRGRNADWAEKAVREAASLPAEQALEKNVIDIVASDMQDLLRQLQGRELTVNGQQLHLRTENIQLISIIPDWRSELLAIITNPNIAYILMLIGIYGLIFEFSNPGAILPGVVGGISLLLALFAFQVLPINYAGLALILLGLALMVAEAFAPSFGILGLGGVIAFVIGSIMLMDTEAPGYGISWALIGGLAATSAVLLSLVLGMAVRSRNCPVVSGHEQMLESTGVALENFSLTDSTYTGTVRVHSEHWQAHSNTPLRKGDSVRVTTMSGLVLTVVTDAPSDGIPILGEPLDKS